MTENATPEELGAYVDETAKRVGLPIAAWSVINGNGAAIAALAFAFFGAGLGWFMRRGVAAAR